ncbi:MAG: DUF3143 domain-containing protein [Cyanobacteria bacterium P01_H01_bin.15]
MKIPSADTPLYNHPLPVIEQWLRDHGCQQKKEPLNCWDVSRSQWQAELSLEVEVLSVRYFQAGDNGDDVVRSFPYSLSREDVEAAIFSGP